MGAQPHVLRRYVIERASGRAPRDEWAYYAANLGAWIRTNEMTARRHEHHRRIRTEGLPWCNVLGHQTDVHDDEALQIFFMTVSREDWPRLAAAIRERPARCLRDWTSSGKLIMAAVTPETAGPLPNVPGSLDGWPSERGSGQRSLMPR
jgi:hypothetical protein